MTVYSASIRIMSLLLPARSSRPSLLVPLCVSLVAHGLLLLGAIQFVLPGGELPPGPINVVVGRSGEARSAGGRQVPLPVPALEKPVLPPGKAAVVSAREKVNEAQARVEPQPAPASVQQALPVPGVPGVDTGSGRAVGTGTAIGRESGKEGGVGPNVNVNVNADDLRFYRLSLASAAKRFKRYPALARERGWEGTVEISIGVSAALPLPEVGIAKSSGRVVLDDQAREMLLQAVRSTPVPDGLKGRDLKIVLPVRFGLDDD